MDFKRIFTHDKECTLWSVCYPEHETEGKIIDIFRVLLNQWKDVEYLDTFFNDHEERLNTYWNLDIDQAFKRVELESLTYQIRLRKVAKKEEGFEEVEIKDLFDRLHKNETLGINFNESHRKTKPLFEEPILRIYAIELEDGTIIITGGGIKLYRTMQQSGLSGEIDRLKEVQQYLTDHNITTKQQLE